MKTGLRFLEHLTIKYFLILFLEEEEEEEEEEEGKKSHCLIQGQ